MKKSNLLQILPVILVTIISLAGLKAAAQEAYPKTPADYEGPFYPVTKQQDIDNDLVHVQGHTGIAKGDILNLSGIVVNTKGEPQQEIIIEIWQTDPQGRYKHPGDSSPGERDPNFQYWGATFTDAEGRYYFKTVVPGAYEPRPAHIHYKVLKDGKVLLISQIYFMKSDENAKQPSMTSRIDLQTVDLKSTKSGEFEAFFRIVL